MNKEINKKYLTKIDEINNYFVKNDYVLDNEGFHCEMDDLLENLLKELGYEEIVKKYNEASFFFWYS